MDPKLNLVLLLAIVAVGNHVVGRRLVLATTDNVQVVVSLVDRNEQLLNTLESVYVNCLRQNLFLIVEDLLLEKLADHISVRCAPGLVAHNLVEPVKEKACVALLSHQHAPSLVYHLCCQEGLVIGCALDVHESLESGPNTLVRGVAFIQALAINKVL